MKPNRRIFVGSRRSRLATLQSRSVIAILRELHPDLEFDLIEITTSGDRNKKTSLEILGGEGVFVKELEEALLQRKIDMAVHSAKDMPTDIPEGLRLAAVTERVDPRDVIISRSGKLAELSQGAKIGTGSQRRAVQITAQRPDIQICGLRGNIDTRIRNVSSGRLDAIILAAAALIRLRMTGRITEYLSPEDFVPAVGQGALGIEIRADDTQIAEIAAPLNHVPTWQSVVAERAFLRTLGGGCRAPICALGTVDNGMLRLSGMVANPDGSAILRDRCEGTATEPEKVGTRLAQKMIETGAISLIGMERA